MAWRGTAQHGAGAAHLPCVRPPRGLRQRRVPQLQPGQAVPSKCRLLTEETQSLPGGAAETVPSTGAPRPPGWPSKVRLSLGTSRRGGLSPASAAGSAALPGSAANTARTEQPPRASRQLSICRALGSETRVAAFPTAETPRGRAARQRHRQRHPRSRPPGHCQTRAICLRPRGRESSGRARRRGRSAKAARLDGPYLHPQRAVALGTVGDTGVGGGAPVTPPPGREAAGAPGTAKAP